MPNIKSAAKRMRQSAKNQTANRMVKSAILTANRRLHETLKADDKAARVERFRKYCSVLDKAVKKSVIRANNADRHRSRAARALAAAT